MKKVLLFGHRGAAGEAPENTIAAFELALSSGMDGIELDVRLCRSGEVVVAHDAELARITCQNLPVDAYCYSDLKKLDAGAHFSEKFKGERIPMLYETIDLFADKLVLDIELKGRGLSSNGLEQKVISIVREKKIQERVILSSFNPLILRRVIALAPEIKIGLNYINDPVAELRRAWFFPISRPYSIHPAPEMVDDRMLKFAKKRGALLIPWKVNSDHDILKMLESGADGIISDFPSRLKKVYNGRATRDNN